MEVFIIGYLILSIIVGFLGVNSPLGFWGGFILSIFFSPVIPLLFILLMKNKNQKNTEKPAKSFFKKAGTVSAE
jgi:hypothetical protein